MLATEELAIAERNIPQIRGIRKLCTTLVNLGADGRPGVTDEQIYSLEKKRRDYRAFRDVCNGKRRNDQSVIARLRARGFEVDNITIDGKTEAFIGAELLDALLATFQHIKDIASNAMAVRDRQPLDTSQSYRLAAEANREFFDFFIKIHKQLKLSDGQMAEIFNLLFEDLLLDKELSAVALGHFPAGLLAAVKGYMYLSRQLPEGRFRVSSIDQDLNNSVDLIFETEQEVRYYELKGTSQSTRIEIIDLSDLEAVERLRKKIESSHYDQDSYMDQREKYRRLASIEKLDAYIRQQKNADPRKVSGYYVEIPTG